MDKLAQRRRLNLGNKLREDFDISGQLTEKFSPEFASLMEKLREVDESVRELAASDEDGGTLKSLLKVAKSNFNRREYVNTVIYLGKFHEKLEQIKGQFGGLQRDLSKAHNEFLFGDLDEDQKEFLMKKLPEKFKPKSKKAKVNFSLIKEAGPADFWHNMTTERGRALKAWEKRFPQFAKQLRKDTEKMINRSEVMFQALSSTLKELATFRGKRQLEEYVKAADAFTKKYDQYDDFFNEYYNSNVSKLIETQQGIDAATVEKLQESAPAPEAVVESPAKESGPDAEISSPPAMSDPTPPSSDGGGGIPADFPQPPSYTGLNPDIANKMKELEKQMGGEETYAPAASILALPSSATPKTNTDFIAPPVDSALDTEGEPVFPLAPRTNKVPSMPYNTTEHPPAPVSSIRTLRNPTSQELEEPAIPKPPPVPKEFNDLLKQEVHTKLPPARLNKIQENDATPSPQTVRSASENFIAELSASSHESPLVLANKIVKFANSIAESDNATSEKLLSIAKKILSTL